MVADGKTAPMASRWMGLLCLLPWGAVPFVVMSTLYFLDFLAGWPVRRDVAQDVCIVALVLLPWLRPIQETWCEKQGRGKPRSAYLLSYGLATLLGLILIVVLPRLMG